MHEIQSDSKIVLEANETGKTLPELTAAVEEPPKKKVSLDVYSIKSVHLG
ncbi:hypothetical protein AB3538_02800 [Acinetobacter baumannii]